MLNTSRIAIQCTDIQL